MTDDTEPSGDHRGPDTYDAAYYRDYTGGEIPYDRDEKHWQDFFGAIADRIVADINPRTTLDAGCAIGMLVEALCERGVDARGVDVSDYAISQTREDLRERFWVGSLTDPLPDRYDLITCIEVLEHLEEPDAQKAVRILCAASDDILLSTSPNELAEETHINVRPPAYWAELFAREGFFRDPGYDASYLTYWAVRFRRRSEPIHRTVAEYESVMWQLAKEKGERDPIVIRQFNEIKALRAEYDVAMGALAPTRDALCVTQEALEETRHGLEATRDALREAREKLSGARHRNAALKEANAELRGKVEVLSSSPTNRLVRRLRRRSHS